MMSKREFYRVCLSIAEADRRWLVQAVTHPQPHHRPIHLALMRLALRRTA